MDIVFKPIIFVTVPNYFFMVYYVAVSGLFYWRPRTTFTTRTLLAHETPGSETVGLSGAPQGCLRSVLPVYGKVH